MWFEGIAWAQAAAASGAPQDLFGQIITNPVVPIAFIFIIMYFLLLRPQTKKASDLRKMLDSLKRNDEVVTTGGLIGKVAELDDRLVTLEIAPNVRVRVERTQIASMSSYARSSKREKSDKN
ncbi:MAG TPA: preprotein translocase subunit YajC [Candidatus Binataceae bacterium]|nr:preprotein translocase subunit YajC [Candidatus Binataceae bacterium]